MQIFFPNIAKMEFFPSLMLFLPGLLNVLAEEALATDIISTAKAPNPPAYQADGNSSNSYFNLMYNCTDRSDGFYAVGPCDEKFYSCENGNLEHHYCPQPYLFNPHSGFCEEILDLFPSASTLELNVANEFSNKNESSQVPVKEDENKNHLGTLANLVSALFLLPPKNQTAEDPILAGTEQAHPPSIFPSENQNFGSNISLLAPETSPQNNSESQEIYLYASLIPPPPTGSASGNETFHVPGSIYVAELESESKSLEMLLDDNHKQPGRPYIGAVDERKSEPGETEYGMSHQRGSGKYQKKFEVVDKPPLTESDFFLFPFSSILVPKNKLKDDKVLVDDFQGKNSYVAKTSNFAPILSELNSGHDAFKGVNKYITITSNFATIDSKVEVGHDAFRSKRFAEDVCRRKLADAMRTSAVSDQKACNGAKYAVGCQPFYSACVNGRSVMRYCGVGFFFNTQTEMCEHRERVLACSLGQSKVISSPAPVKPPVSSPAITESRNFDENFCQVRTDGFYRHPLNCSRILQCFGGDLFEYPSCDQNLAFNEEKISCDYREMVPGCEESKQTSEQALTGTIESSQCTHGDHFVHETDCHKFYKCVWTKKIEVTCPQGTVFNQNARVCDFLSRVPRCHPKVSSHV